MLSKQKLLKSIILLFLTAIIIVPAIASAEIETNRFSISPFIGGVVFDDDYQAEHGLMGGLRFGYDYTKNLGVEASYGYIGTRFDTQSKELERDASGHTYKVEGLYHFFPDSVIVPHVTAGVGGLTMFYETGNKDNFSKFALDYGVGLSYFMIKNLALRADLRHVYLTSDGNSDFEYSLGLTYYIDARASGPEPDKDSDHDGVLDSYDKCPNTPRGDKVDAVGCTVDVDDDHDGVLNSRDKCPNTPIGDKVDSVGCTVDGDDDHDGALNSRDKCPTTPKSDRVDAVGCTIKEKVSINLLVEFDTDKSVIKPQFHNNIKRAADFMQKYPDSTAVIEGHTDSAGNHVHNMNLSKRRAESVVRYMVEEFGISASRLKAEGYGPHRPVSSNLTKEGRQENRRVVAVIEGIK